MLADQIRDILAQAEQVTPHLTGELDVGQALRQRRGGHRRHPLDVLVAVRS
jgi:hypothetical protein